MISKTGNIHVKHAIITGACGWIGRRLVHFLLKEGFGVTAIDSCKEFPVKLEKRLTKFFRFVSGDLISVIEKSFGLDQIDCDSQTTLFHLAGRSHAGECQKFPKEAFRANVHLTEAVLEFCRKNDIKRFIFPSTGLVYGNSADRTVTEDSPAYPYNIYSATKLAAENLIHGYAGSFCLGAVIVRLSNVYGCEGHQDTVSQIILRQVMDKKDPIKFQSGSPVRDFIFIEDVIGAFYKLLSFAIEPGCKVFNVSTGIGVSISTFAETACKIAGISTDRIRITDNAERPSSLVMDNRSFKDHVGWMPKYSLNDGIENIIKKGNVIREKE